MCEVAFLLALAVLALYIVPLYTPVHLVFQLSIVTAGLAVATAIGAVIAYFVPLKKESYMPTLSVYLLLSATSASLVMDTGSDGSPFIALWLLVGFFAAVFGLAGILPLLAATAAFVGYEYLQGNFASAVVIALFSGFLPVIAGIIVWHNANEEGEEEDRKTNQTLASELGDVAGRSEIIINAIGDGVIAVDAQGVIQLINPAAQELLGWGKQDAMQLNYKSVLHLLDSKNADLLPENDPVQQSLNTNQEVRTDVFQVQTKGEKKLWVNIVVSPIGNLGSGVIVVFRDVTREKSEAREQAEFISTASHEMRTPVASIEGYLGLALNPNTAQIDQKARDFILKAHESAQHLGQLFQDLLDVSKADDRRLSNNPKVVDLTQFTHDIVEGLEQKATDKGIRLVYKPIPLNNDTVIGGEHNLAPVYYVNLDNDHIREIIDNLTENAIKYTPAGEVVVDVNGDNEKVTVSIKDSGIGIPAEDIPHLFQKFYRVDDAETRQIGGTGLGLYLCRKLAEAMGGRIYLESEYKKGSTFFLELPRITTEQAMAAKQQQDKADAAAAAAATVAPTVGIMPTDVPATPTTAAALLTPMTPASGQSADLQHNVPRGEALTREQIAAKVAQLEALAKQNPQPAAAPAAPTALPVAMPVAPAAPVVVSASPPQPQPRPVAGPAPVYQQPVQVPVPVSVPFQPAQQQAAIAVPVQPVVVAAPTVLAPQPQIIPAPAQSVHVPPQAPPARPAGQ